jgi:hypothetical protein
MSAIILFENKIKTKQYLIKEYPIYIYIFLINIFNEL